MPFGPVVVRRPKRNRIRQASQPITSGRHCHERHPDLCKKDQPAAVDYVAQHTRRQSKQEERQRRCRLGERDIQRPGLKGHHQPGRPDALHECANVGKDVRDEQITEGLSPQRSPHARRCPNTVLSGRWMGGCRLHCVKPARSFPNSGDLYDCFGRDICKAARLLKVGT